MSINLEKDRMLCMVIPEDKISVGAIGVMVEGWTRGFVMQDRATDEIYGLWRMKRVGGERNWYEIRLKPGHDNPMEYIRQSLVQVFQVLIDKIGIPAEVACFYPPPELDALATIKWLEKMDLVEVVAIEMEGNHERS